MMMLQLELVVLEMPKILASGVWDKDNNAGDENNIG